MWVKHATDIDIQTCLPMLMIQFPIYHTAKYFIVIILQMPKQMHMDAQYMYTAHSYTQIAQIYIQLNFSNILYVH